MSMIILPLQNNPVERTPILIKLNGSRLSLSPSSTEFAPNEPRELYWKFDGQQPGDLMIVFKPTANARTFDSPFRGCRFRCPKGGGCLSGRPEEGKTRTQVYKYTVTLTIPNPDGAPTVRTATGSVLVAPPSIKPTKKPKKKTSLKTTEETKYTTSSSTQTSTALKSAKAGSSGKASTPKAAVPAKPKSKKAATKKAGRK